MTDELEQLEFGELIEDWLPPDEKPDDRHPRWQPLDEYGVQHGHINLNKSKPCTCDTFYINALGHRMCAHCWPLPRLRRAELGYQLMRSHD